MASAAQDTDEAADTGTWIFRGATILGGVGLALSYVLAWAEVVGLTRERGSGGERVAVGPDDVLRQQGFQDNAGATITGADIELFPVIVAALGVLVVVAAALRWRLVVQAISSLFGLIAVLIGVFFWSFVTSGDDQFIQVGSHEGPASSFEPAIGVWLVLLCGVVVLVFGIGGAIYDYQQSQPSTGSSQSWASTAPGEIDGGEGDRSDKQ
jgi:hypothetical protein